MLKLNSVSTSIKLLIGSNLLIVGSACVMLITPIIQMFTIDNIISISSSLIKSAVQKYF